LVKSLYMCVCVCVGARARKKKKERKKRKEGKLPFTCEREKMVKET